MCGGASIAVRQFQLKPNPYMDAPILAGLSVPDGLQERLHPYIRTFAAACAAVPAGIGWLAPIRFLALEVLRIDWILPTTL
jgi:hypothetical protein